MEGYSNNFIERGAGGHRARPRPAGAAPPPPSGEGKKTIRRAVRSGHHLPGRRALRLGGQVYLSGRGRRHPRGAVRRRHVAPTGNPVRAAAHPAELLPAPRRVAPVAGDARGRTAGPVGLRRGRRRDVLRRRRAFGARSAGSRPRGDQCRGHPAGARRRPHDRLARRGRRGAASRPGPHLDDPLRRARRHRRHRVRLARRVTASRCAG